MIMVMELHARFSGALRAGLIHLSGSAVVALIAAALVFWLWYPHPYSELVGGRELFWIVVSVDVISGPLLTAIVFDRTKRHKDLIRDIICIVMVQLAALAYGLHSVYLARPVYLAFEGKVFRVVGVPDIDTSALDQAPESLRVLSATGPKLLGVRLARETDPDYRQSIQLSLEGNPPAFRPSRWLPYDSQRAEVSAQAIELSILRKKHPADGGKIDALVARHGGDIDHLGYLPLFAGANSEWVVVIMRQSAEPIGFLKLDGW